MKNFLLAIAVFTFTSLSFANNGLETPNALEISKAVALAQSDAVRVANLLNWQVGEFQNHKISLSFLNGTMEKEVTKDVPADNTVWLTQVQNMMGQRQVVETLFDRATAEVKKMLVNGEEQDLSGGDDREIEIIEQYETEVTVPARSEAFECMYVKAKITAEGQETELEMWANPIDVNIDGQLKLVAQTQFGPLTMELTEFGKN